MYATIRRYDHVTGAPDDRLSAGRALAVRVGIVTLTMLISAGDERRRRGAAILAATPRRDP